MTVIVIFWVDADNFKAVVKWESPYTLEEIVRAWEKKHNYTKGSCFGIETDLEEVM